MITTNQENLLEYLDNDIEANQTKSIKQEDEDTTEPPVNHSSDHGDHLQEHLVVTGIPLIAIDSKDEEVGKCEENEGSAGVDPLVSRNLFLRHFACGLMLGSFFVWPAIRICFFYLITRCKPIGNLFFLEDKEQDPEMPHWFMAFYYDPDRASAIWRIIFSVETYLVNKMVMILFLAIYLSKDGCLHMGKLHGAIYSSMITNVISFLVRITTRSGDLHVELSLVAIIIAIVGYALAVAVTAANGAIHGLGVNLIVYAIWSAVCLLM
jgi:hypothetical protein